MEHEGARTGLEVQGVPVAGHLAVGVPPSLPPGKRAFDLLAEEAETAGRVALHIFSEEIPGVSERELVCLLDRVVRMHRDAEEAAALAGELEKVPRLRELRQHHQTLLNFQERLVDLIDNPGQYAEHQMYIPAHNAKIALARIYGVEGETA